MKLSHFFRSPKIRLAFIFFLVMTAFSGWNVYARTNSGKTNSWQTKVDPQVLSSAASGETDFLVFMDDQADLSGAAVLTTKQEKGQYVFKHLTTTALRTQAGLIKSLETQKIPYRSYWVANMVWVRGNIAAVENVARRSDVAHIYEDPWVQSTSLDVSTSGVNSITGIKASSMASAPASIQWNISLVNAPQVWAEGFTGQGVVVGGQDTGYQWDHPALKEKYRGWDGVSASHDYNWHDAIHEDNPNSSGENSCGLDLTEPCDDNGHGTHTMGIMVGDDGDTHQIGMAPGAQWIGCRNMEESWGKPSTYIECFEWFIAPYPIGGDKESDADPTKAPDVINNSWACPSTEGCAWDALQTVVDNTRAAGIMVVGSAGNYGSSCGSVQNPIAIYDSTFSIGATNSSDVIANFSSRGPSQYTNLLKPDVSAPGVSVYSSVVGDSYSYKDGTSMAAPHVAGLVALLISANPGLAGQVDTLEDIIRHTAVPLTDTVSCGSIPGDSIPNNTYGWGRIDAYAAYQQVHHLEITKTASATTITPGDLVTYTLSITHSLSLSPTTGVVITDVLPEHTLFVSATTPYTLTDGQILWEIPSLAANANRDFQLTVEVPITFTGLIENNAYGVKSDDYLLPALGEPMIVLSGKYHFYLSPIFQP
jgi:serine protease AprX